MRVTTEHAWHKEVQIRQRLRTNNFFALDFQAFSSVIPARGKARSSHISSRHPRKCAWARRLIGDKLDSRSCRRFFKAIIFGRTCAHDNQQTLDASSVRVCCSHTHGCGIANCVFAGSFNTSPSFHRSQSSIHSGEYAARHHADSRRRGRRAQPCCLPRNPKKGFHKLVQLYQRIFVQGL